MTIWNQFGLLISLAVEIFLGYRIFLDVASLISNSDSSPHEMIPIETISGHLNTISAICPFYSVLYNNETTFKPTNERSTWFLMNQEVAGSNSLQAVI